MPTGLWGLLVHSHRLRLLLAPALLVPALRPWAARAPEARADEVGATPLVLAGPLCQEPPPLHERFGASPADVPFPSAPPDEGALRAGEWTLWIQSFATGNLARRAVARHQRVLRMGPDDARPQLLHEQASTGRVKAWLRDDGLAVVQPIGPEPRLVWPGGDASELDALPRPPAAAGSSYRDLERVWFLGDAIVYDRNPSVDRYAVAVMWVDVDQRVVTRHRLLLSVGGAPDQQPRCRDERIDERELLRVGDYLLWCNQGGRTVARALRAADLRSGAALRPDAVEVRARDREALLAWCEGRRADADGGAGPWELETWAVGQLARIGRAQDAQRLHALREAIEGDDHGRAALRAAYEAALETLGAR
jgi:hypothetical protein